MFLVCCILNSLPDVICHNLTAPANGVVDISSYLAFGTAVFSCDHGYRLIGEKDLYCLQNELWSGDVPICEGNPLHVEFIVVVVREKAP